MSFFHFVEQNKRKWFLSYSLGQTSCSLFTRTPNQAINATHFLILTHVKTYHTIFSTKIYFCNSFCQFGFSNSSWSKKKKICNWTLGRTNFSPSTSQCIGYH